MSRTVPRSAIALAAAALLGGAALADVDVQVLSGDKVAATFSPAAETETFRVLAPSGASFSCKAKGAKKGPAVHVVFDPFGNDPAVTGAEKGLAASVPATVLTRTGESTIRVTSRDGVTAGAYSFSAKWTPRTKWPFAADALLAQTDATLVFGAERGAVVGGSLAKSKVAGVLPKLVRIDGPDGFTHDLTGMTTFAALTLPETADYTLVYRNDGATAGRVAGSVKVKPPKTKPRTIDVTTSVLGGGDAGESAFARIVGPDGGVVAVPDLGLGGGLDDISGSSVAFPAAALPSATSIVIGTAPAITVAAAGPGLGPTVFFGPAGLAFGTKSAPLQATITIPVELSLVKDDASKLAVYVRDAKGNVTLVPGPYDTTTNPGFVSFPGAHFSSYAPLATGPLPVVNPETIFSVTSAQKIVAANSSFGNGARLFLLDGGTRTVRLLTVTSPTAPPTLTLWAGGGAMTADGTDRLSFDFQGPPVAASARPDGTLYVSAARKVFRIAANGQVTRIIGTGNGADTGDNGPGTAAEFQSCYDLAATPSGVFLADALSARVRFWASSDQMIVTEFGLGFPSFGPDGDPVATAPLRFPTSIAVRPGGGLYVGDEYRIRALDRGAGTNVTVAGDPMNAQGSADSAVAATSARFRNVWSMSVDPTANTILVADLANATVRLVNLGANSVTTIVGIPGVFTTSPDDTPAPFSIFQAYGALPGPVANSIFFLEGDGRLRVFRLP